VTKTQYGKVMALFPEKGDYGNYKYSLKEGVALESAIQKTELTAKSLNQTMTKQQKNITDCSV
jgi:hypothetical protein